MKNKKGFTLIVIAILAVIILIGTAAKIVVGIRKGGTGGSEESGGGTATAIIANEDVALGAYVTYSPTSEEDKNETYTVLAEDSGYTEDQTFTLGKTTSWRVLKNNSGQLDIISTDSVGRLLLIGEKGYVKAVYTLNELCKQYANPTYATGARAPGYVEGSSCEIIDTGEYPITWTNTYTNGVKGFPYTDTLYSTDVDQINTAGVTSRTVWLASRRVDVDGSFASFDVHYLSSGGNVYYDAILYDAYSGGDVYSRGDSFGVCPIVSLKSEIKITGGEGTQVSPYILSID